MVFPTYTMLPRMDILQTWVSTFWGLVLVFFEYNLFCVSAEIVPTTYRNVALESRLYLPAIMVVHEWLLSKIF